MIHTIEQISLIGEHTFSMAADEEQLRRGIADLMGAEKKPLGGAWGEYYEYKDRAEPGTPRAYAIVGLKKELAYRGYGDGLDFTTPFFGAAARDRTKEFQLANKIGLKADGTPTGVIASGTARKLFKKRVWDAAHKSEVPALWLCRQINLESGFDPAAVGNVDPRDRGLVQINCVSPDTKILGSDLNWHTAENIRSGLPIIGFTENRQDNTGFVAGRRFCPAFVEANKLILKNCHLIRTDFGDVVTSEDHMWLARKCVGGHNQLRTWQWIKTKDLIENEYEVSFFSQLWERNESWKAGWLAGIFDGEGSLLKNETSRYWMLSIAQSNRNPKICQAIENNLADLGFEFTNVVSYKNDSTRFPCNNYRIGGRNNILRFLGTIAPYKTLDLIDDEKLWNDGIVSRLCSPVLIKEIRNVGIQEVSTIQTSSRTLVTNGFMSHNSYWHPEVDDEEAFTPAFSIPWAAEYFSGNLKALGDVDAALAAHNVGRFYARNWLVAGKPASGLYTAEGKDYSAIITKYLSLLKSRNC